MDTHEPTGRPDAEGMPAPTYAFAEREPDPFGGSPPPAVPVTASKASGLRRIVATAALTIGLLAVGGVSVVMAASPAPSPSSGPSTTLPNGTAPNGTHAGGCPNMGGSSSPSATSGS
jgi:hypothetical protein